MRTPFNSLVATVEIMEDKGISESTEEFKLRLQNLRKQARELNYLSENLLDWARSQVGELRYESELFNISDIIHAMLRLINPQAQQKGILIESRIPWDMQAYGDRHMLATVIRNLVANAVKYTPKGGKIFLEAETAENEIIVHVVDNGKGISEERIPDLFSQRTKRGTPGTEGERGSGLGLLVCKDFIKKQHGDLWVTSTPNVETRFSFSVPSKA